jgi:hypothetical protein
MGKCCTGCDRPAEYWFTDLATGREGEMCKAHRDALDVGKPEKFMEVGGDEKLMAELVPEITGAYSRGKSSDTGSRIIWLMIDRCRWCLSRLSSKSSGFETSGWLSIGNRQFLRTLGLAAPTSRSRTAGTSFSGLATRWRFSSGGRSLGGSPRW